MYEEYSDDDEAYWHYQRSGSVGTRIIGSLSNKDVDFGNKNIQSNFLPNTQAQTLNSSNHYLNNIDARTQTVTVESEGGAQMGNQVALNHISAQLHRLLQQMQSFEQHVSQESDLDSKVCTSTYCCY